MTTEPPRQQITLSKFTRKPPSVKRNKPSPGFALFARATGRPAPRDEADAELLLITKHGRHWAKEVSKIQVGVFSEPVPFFHSSQTSDEPAADLVAASGVLC